MLRRRLSVPIKGEVLAHITDISGGYPALVVSIADQLLLGARSGTAARSLEAIVAGSRVAGLLPLHVDTVVTDGSPETRGALLALALGGQLTLEEVSVALTGLGLGPADIDALMATGLVDRIGNMVRIRHSVAKRAVLERSGASQVRTVHAALGEALPGRRGLEHRAASAVGPEAERVGREIKEQVEAALLHRDYALAYGLATSAIGLDPTWVTEAVLDAMRMGQPARVVELADRIEALVPSVTRSVGLAVAELERDQIEAAENRLSGIQVDHITDDREVVLVAHGILHAVSHAAAHAWVNVGERFAPLVARLDARSARGSMDPAYGLELTVNLIALHIVLDHLLNDDVPPADRIEGLAQLRTQITHAVGGDVLDPFLRTLMALLRFYSGHLATAESELSALQIKPAPLLRHQVEAVRATIAFHNGDWDRASAIANDSLASSLDALQSHHWMQTFSVAAMVPACRGEEAYVERFLLSTDLHMAAVADAWRRQSLAWAATVDGRQPALVVEHLEPMWRQGLPGYIGGYPTGILLLRAQLAVGLTSAAQATRALLADEPYDMTLKAYTLAHSDALLAAAAGDDAAAAGAFARALGAFQEGAHDNPRASLRLHLALLAEDWATWVSHADAPVPTALREVLEESAALMERTGAARWKARLVDCLDRLGIALDAGHLAYELLAGLTTREREVALLIGKGMTNRQIAERLFITVRTAEYHVNRALTKLGLRSRVALRTALGKGPGNAGETSATRPAGIW